MIGRRRHAALAMLALGLLATGAAAGDSAPKTADYLLEQAIRFNLRSAGESTPARVAALDAFLRATEPPRSETQRAIELLATHQRWFAADGGASTLPALEALWRRYEEPTRALSPAEQLQLASIDATYESLATAGIGCCLCGAWADYCSDGLFCNGTESCGSSNTCVQGPDPCVDGDLCTTDLCNEGTDSCVFDPLPPPPEVALLEVDRDSEQPTLAKLGWTSVAGADAYNVYRGTFSDLSDLGCFAPNLPDTIQYDADLPSGVFLYLVSSVGCSESGLGDATSGPRPPPPPCP